jgi:hypothetical protein
MLSFQHLIGTFAVFCSVFLRLFDRNFCGPLLEAFAESMGRNPKSMALDRRLWVQKNLQDESWRFGAENETRTMSYNMLIISDLKETEKTTGET